LAEWAIDQLKGDVQELNQFRAELIKGADKELYELPTSGTLRGIEMETKKQLHRRDQRGVR